MTEATSPDRTGVGTPVCLPSSLSSPSEPPTPPHDPAALKLASQLAQASAQIGDAPLKKLKRQARLLDRAFHLLLVQSQSGPGDPRPALAAALRAQRLFVAVYQQLRRFELSKQEKRTDKKTKTRRRPYVATLDT